MARGTQSKTAIFNKLMEVYPDAFFEDEGKILRIPVNEDGELVEIKVTLTAAKNNLNKSNIQLSAFDNSPPELAPDFMPAPAAENQDLAPSQEEKDNVSKLLASLGL